jgi:hypothetical protein
MQKYHLLLLLATLTTPAFAQSIFESFNNLEIITCPYDSGAQVIWPKNWSIYHTTNDQWDGEVDSSWCISLDGLVSPPDQYTYLNAEQIDGSRPVFFRYTGFRVKPFALLADWLYSIDAYMELQDEASLIIGQSTPPQSGVVLSFDIPAEDSISRDQRIRYFEFQDSTDWVLTSSCVATEKFADQELKEMILALSFRHALSKGPLVELGGVVFMMLYDFGVVDKTIIDPQWWMDTSYVVPLEALASNGPWNLNFILPYTLPDYPSSAHISYLDLSPSIPSDTAQTITVVVEKYMTLNPQPFTAFRGDLVGTTDTMRHFVQLLNNGGDFCITAVEINFEDGSSYLHKAGTVSLGSDLSCMMFKSGSRFEVGENTPLDYGHQGMGFLAMKQGSQLILNNGSEMTIHNTLVLQLSPTSNHTDPTVFLYPGSHLIFGTSGNLEAWGEGLKLRVMMLGGSLETKHLSDEELKLIEFVYPEIPAFSDREGITLIKHPSGRTLNVYLNNDHAFTGTIWMFDAIGRPLYNSTVDVPSEDFYYPMQLDGLSSGWYVISVESPNGVSSASFTFID